MKRLLLVLNALAILIFLCAISVSPAAGQSDDRSAEPIDGWLAGADRQDSAWRVHLSTPRLTFQQRYLVHVRANIPPDAFKSVASPPVLHFVIKVADASGHWLPQEIYREFMVPPELTSNQEIQLDSGLYLRQGDYTVAVIAYGQGPERYNLSRKMVHTGSIKNDPLPDLDRDLSPVEFIADFPRDALTLETPTGRGISRVRQQITIAPENDQTWLLGHGKEWLPIANRRPVRIDVVLDVSDWSDPDMKTKISPQAYRQNVGRDLQIGSVLSHLAPQNGCVRVSILDILKMRAILNQGDAKTLDWGKIQAAVTKIDQSTVDARALNRGSEKAEFLANSLARVSDSSGCAANDERTLHAIVVLPASKIQIPDRKQLEGPPAKTASESRYFYLRPAEARGDPGSDDIQAVLKPLQPIRYDASDPADFRKDLAKMIADIEAATSDADVPRK